ncbi:hypothetical protein B9Z55_004351 [Caenorhabditis nigoni]|uniref:DUF7809 domain-containing protein n=1 Tax=Caenorhabditis nigoni TaxID=1611254 RepID=A0A2G5UWG6_9PELO|nr:hypothetical protein B9Z55_004351 [Caenorhabditis nigoni]
MAAKSEPPENARKFEIRLSTALEYILGPLRKSIEDVQNFLTEGVDSNQTLEEILAIGDPDLRMYGSVEELAENIKIFKNFPESFRFFSAITPNTSFVYKNLKNEDFFCKSDLLTIIRNVALFAVQDHPLLSQFNYDLGQFLRELVPGSSEHVEFWKFDFATYNGIWKEISDGHDEANRNAGRLRDELTPYVRDRHFNYIDSKMKEFNSIAWHEDHRSFFSNMFKSKKCTDKDIMNRLYVYFVDAGTMNCFRKLIDSRPALFGPNPKTVAPTVRLFEDGPFKFVMKQELFNAINRNSDLSNFILFNESEKHVISSMEWEDVLEFYGDRIGDIEFIRYPIQRSKHRAVYLQGPTRDGFCVLCVDALFDSFLKFLIFGAKSLQRAKCWQDICRVLDTIQTFCDSDFTPHAFIRVECLANTENQYCEHAANVQAIRNVPADGFTQRTLEIELARLGLTTISPEIQNYANIVFREIEKRKKGEFLRTSDMFDAVEMCQILCIFKRYPKLQKFLHKQMRCHRVVGLECEYCEAQDTWTDDEDSENQKPSEASESSEFEIQNRLEMLKILGEEPSEIDKVLEEMDRKDAEAEAENSTIQETSESTTSDIENLPESTSGIDDLDVHEMIGKMNNKFAQFEKARERIKDMGKYL